MKLRKKLFEIFAAQSKGTKKLFDETMKYGKFRYCIRFFLIFKIIKLNYDDMKNNKNKMNIFIENNMIFKREDTLFWLPSIRYDRKKIVGEYVQKEIFIREEFYEEKILRDLLNKMIVNPNMTIVDVGANIGNHSLFFANILKAKKVIAIEPIKENFNILKKNIEINGLNNVVLYNVGLGSYTGKGQIYSIDHQNMGSTELQYGEQGDISIYAMDELLKGENIDFIKIDVEGFEYEVLLGAKEILEVNKPILFIEIFEERFQIVQEYLTSFGYEMKAKYGSNYVWDLKL